MAQKIINTSTPNDGLGEPLRDSFNDTNDNFTELYNNKVDKVSGKGLSTNDYSNADETKLQGIESGAEVNVQANWTQTNNSADDYIKNKPTNYVTCVGSLFYQDLATITTPLTFVNNVEKKLVNDKAGSATDTTQPPYGISSTWNSTTNQFDFTQLTLGDLVTVRVSGEIVLQANESYKFVFKVGVGSASSTTFYTTAGFQKDAGTYPVSVSIPFSLYKTDFIDYPSEVYLLSEGTGTFGKITIYTEIVRKNVNIVEIAGGAQNIDEVLAVGNTTNNKQIFTTGSGNEIRINDSPSPISLVSYTGDKNYISSATIQLIDSTTTQFLRLFSNLIELYDNAKRIALDAPNQLISLRDAAANTLTLKWINQVGNGTLNFPNAGSGTKTLATDDLFDINKKGLVPGPAVVVGNILSDDGTWIPMSSGGSTDLSYTSATNQGTVNSSTGTDAVIPLFDTTKAGLVPYVSGGIAGKFLSDNGNWEVVQNGSFIKVTVNDSNYTIPSVSANYMIVMTNITSPRTITLPPTNTQLPGSQIIFVDESLKCSATRTVTFIPNGTDTFGGLNPVLNFPGGSATVESNGVNQWYVINTTAMTYSSGIINIPSYTDLGTGSVTIGTGVYTLFANANYSGRPKAFLVTGGTFALTDLTTNYIIATYDTSTGLVAISTTTNVTTINNSTVIPIFKIYRDGLVLHKSDYDSLGLGLSNKLQTSFEKTQPYRFNLGTVLVSESATRLINISSGACWTGGIETTLSAVVSNVATTYLFSNSGGVWTKSVVTQYNNTQYNVSGTGGLATLSNNRYAVNFIFRSIGTDNDIAIVLGMGDYTLGEAQTSVVNPNLPSFITSHMALIGRIIVQKNASTATQIDNLNANYVPTAAGVTDHNALQNLQLAANTVTYGHIDDQAQTIKGVKTFTDASVLASGTTIGGLPPATALTDLLGNADGGIRFIYEQRDMSYFLVPTGAASFTSALRAGTLTLSGAAGAFSAPFNYISFASTAVAGNIAFQRGNALQGGTGRTTYMRFKIMAQTADTRFAIGVSNVYGSAPPTNVDINSVINTIGFGKKSTSNNLFTIVSNAGGNTAEGTIDTGLVALNILYELEIRWGSANAGDMKITDVNTPANTFSQAFTLANGGLFHYPFSYITNNLTGSIVSYITNGAICLNTTNS